MPARRVTVSPQGLGLAIITAILPAGTPSVAYSFGLTSAGGTGATSWTLVSQTGLNTWSVSSSGVITGTPTHTEADTLTVSVVDSLLNHVTRTLSLTVGTPVSITTTSPLPGATQGIAYSDTMAATAGTAPYTWSLTSQTGSNTWAVSSAGVVTGTPSTLETDSLVIKVTDALGGTASGTFGLTVNAASSSFDRFIAPNGDDSNTGLLSSPWSITALNSKQSVYHGLKIGIIGDVAGVQTVYTFGTAAGVQTTLSSLATSANSVPNQDVTILQVNGGTSGAPTYVASCDSSGVYRAGWAIIDPSSGTVTPSGGGIQPVGPSMCVIGQSFYMSNAPLGNVPGNVGNVTLDGLVIRGGSYAGINFGDTKPNVNNCIVQNCQVYNCNCSTSGNNPGGITFANHTGTVVTNCLVYNCITTGGTEFPEGMAAIRSYSGLGMVVTGCTFTGCGMSIYMKDGHQYGTFSYNYLDCGLFGTSSNTGIGDFGLMAIVPGTGQTLTVHHNIIVGQGLRTFGDEHLQVTGAINVFQNTFYANSSMTTFSMFGAVAAVWYDPTTGAQGAAFNNNIVWYPGVAGPSNGGWTGAISYNPPTGVTPSQTNFNYYSTGMTFGTATAFTGAGGFTSWKGLGYDVNSILTGTTPFSGTPAVANAGSFAITGSATTASSTGGPVGALDGTGSVGSNLTQIAAFNYTQGPN